ncbi:MAG: hypothetical protein IPG43_14430 [Proteobacteria bacterium]|nr:hypothetical protein [Pseudomonadota bacterium]
MGIRTGQQYIDSLRDGRVIHAGGERVTDVTATPAFRGVIDTIAALYDAQHQAPHREVLTFTPDGATAAVSATYFRHAPRRRPSACWPAFARVPI